MIVITTPLGHIGHQVLDNLIGTPEELRVIVQNPSDLPVQVPDRVEVIEGSHGDPAVADRALAGADAVFWLTPPDPHAESIEAAYVGFVQPIVGAFRRNSVKRVVGVTALGRGTQWAARAGNVTASLAVDDLIANAGVAYRALANPSFMDNIARQSEVIKNQGMFFSPIDGDRKIPYVATRDIAAAASRLLVDDSWSGFEEVPLLGPEDLSFNDMADVMSDVLGKTVRFQRTTFDAAKERLVGAGMSDAMAQAVIDMGRAKNEGMDNAVVRTPQNTTLTTFREWCEDVLKPAVLGSAQEVAAAS